METAKREDVGVKVLHECGISPAPGSVAPERLPLTFFDYMFLLSRPTTRVFFYDLQCSTPDFLDNHFPRLKTALSLALADFRPLAGRLVPCSEGKKFEIRSSDVDTVHFTVAESGGDFYDMTANHARECMQFQALVPPLPRETETGSPLLALQATVFPGAGVALGIAILHAVADGATTALFLKAWAAACRTPCTRIPPSYERSVIRDTKGLEDIYVKDLQDLRDNRPADSPNLHSRNDLVRSTFVFTREKIEKLRKRLSPDTAAEFSSFAIACGFVWASLAKARGDLGNQTARFGFPADCRTRLDPPAPPATYFGNCLVAGGTTIKGSDLQGEDGVLIASRLIRDAIRDLKSGGFLQGAENWFSRYRSALSSWILIVSGSPNLGLYQVDFGWGRPRKIESTSVDSPRSMSVAEWGEKGNGLEIGLALPRDAMEKFSLLFDGASGRRRRRRPNRTLGIRPPPSVALSGFNNLAISF